MFHDDSEFHDETDDLLIVDCNQTDCDRCRLRFRCFTSKDTVVIVDGDDKIAGYLYIAPRNYRREYFDAWRFNT